MFSLIFTIVSIALVVALVAATMYHGGDTLTQGRATATAAEYVAGAQQVAGAYRMHQALTGQEAAYIKDLVTSGVLASVPKLFQEPDAEWSEVLVTKKNYGVAVDTLANPSAFEPTQEVCKALDKMAGRTPDPSNWPGSGDYAKYQPYGCAETEGGLQFYFKI